MSTARNYLAREIYRSTLVVMLALLGLFSFFTLVDQLDAVNDRFPLSALFYIEALALPTRLYDLLPIGLLIGAIVALAGLAQRNELVILRVSGVGAIRLLGMLWAISLPVMALAIVLSEIITPAAEIRYTEANMVLRGKVEGGRLVSGYWFKEPTENGGSRVINIGKLLSSGEVADLFIYELDPQEELSRLTQAQRGVFENNQLKLTGVSDTIVAKGATGALADALRPTETLVAVEQEPQRQLLTSLTPGRVAAKIATPERMSLAALWDYIGYLQSNQLDADRQIVAVWRKLAYPFTLIVMLTIAAPISYMQTRRGGVGAKMFIGILVGTSFFMVSQLTLNVGTLYRWQPIVTALLPNTLVFLMAFGAVLLMERRRGPKENTKIKQRAEKLTA
jgi:lipopolysaccharide export system permease protein